MHSRDYLRENFTILMSQFWSDIQPVRGVVISSVAGDDINTLIRQWFAKYWDVEAELIASPARGNGIQNAYAEPAKLGTDRWAAMVRAFYPRGVACCVLDCGTAVTFDVVAASGQHLGGWIMPGYRLFQQALSQQTAGIGIRGDTAATPVLLGHNTCECVDIAWHQGIIGLVQRSLVESGQVNVKCFITGGDAKRIQPLLGDEWCYANDLVLQGLAMMTSQN